MSYAYYPGCSLHATGIEYDLSTRAIFNYLGLELVELEGWNCCGASSAHALDHTLGLALPARNLALAQPLGLDLVVPCAACFNRMKSVEHALQADTALKAEIEEAVGTAIDTSIPIRPVLDVLYEDCGPQWLAEQAVLRLQNLKTVPYYGCLLVRPPSVVQFDDPDAPHIMPDLLNAIGAQVMEWSYATDCCGGNLSLIDPDLTYRLVDRLVAQARQAGADTIVTACPLCQVNLEMRQAGEPRMPVFYFTELIGLALGLPEANQWWGRHLIDPRPLLKSSGLLNNAAQPKILQRA